MIAGEAQPAVAGPRSTECRSAGEGPIWPAGSAGKPKVNRVPFYLVALSAQAPGSSRLSTAMSVAC